MVFNVVIVGIGKVEVVSVNFVFVIDDFGVVFILFNLVGSFDFIFFVL